jgi:hypothetical protein
MLTLALGPTLGAAVLLERTWPTMQTDWALILAKVAAVSVVWGLTIAVGWHHGGWAKELKRNSTRSA